MFAVLATLVCGCDPTGLRRIELRLHAPTSESNSIALDSPQNADALKILDDITLRHGFHPSDSEAGYIRVYSFDRPSVEVNGQMRSRVIHCRVQPASPGLLVTFGEYGFLASAPNEEVDLFNDVRAAFIQRYGERNVRSHLLGHP